MSIIERKADSPVFWLEGRLLMGASGQEAREKDKYTSERHDIHSAKMNF